MDKCRVLVVGGAGYIGSHTCLALHEKGYFPIVFDNLSNGHREFAQWGPLEVGDIRDPQSISAALRKHDPEVILHFAGLIEVGESTRNTMEFYNNNVSGALNLLSAALAHDIRKFVFSSTCATYGLPVSIPMDETHQQNPINPYGRTKLLVESAIRDLSRYAGLDSVILRYFNAAGADFMGRIGERHSPETHIIPLAIEAALGKRENFKIFGSEYDTRDGTCLRDYIHVMDLADAHVRAVDYLREGGKSVELNLGSGVGTTVKEIVAAVSEQAGFTIPTVLEGPRQGDSPSLVAANSKAQSVLGWTPRYTLDDIIKTAWSWHKSVF